MGGFRRFLQIVLLLLFLVALVLAAGIFYPIPYLSQFVWTQVLVDWTMRLVLLVVLGLIALYAIFLFFRSCFARTSYSEVKIGGSRGDVNFSKQAVAAIAEQAVQVLPHLYEPEASVTFLKNAEETVVEVQAGVHDVSDVVQLAQVVQTQVIGGVKETLGVDIQQVNVHLTHMNPQNIHQSERFVRQKTSRVQ